MLNICSKLCTVIEADVSTPIETTEDDNFMTLFYLQISTLMCL